jgi:hypothetical protein
LGLEKELRKSRKEKPRHIKRGKVFLSNRENKLVLRIPLIVRISEVAIQP